MCYYEGAVRSRIKRCVSVLSVNAKTLQEGEVCNERTRKVVQQ